MPGPMSSILGTAQRLALAGGVVFLVATALMMSVGDSDLGSVFSGVAFGLLAIGVLLAFADGVLRRRMTPVVESEDGALLDYWTWIRARFRRRGGGGGG